MIKCKLDYSKDLIKAKAKDTPRGLATESLAIIKTIYSELYVRSAEAADEYKRTVQAGMIDPSSPVFKFDVK